ncbi:unnamed protein product [Psylliodes chrysocephalus]|uniref:Uncharacterized protein n=1 Tax=Psylliodes chrysocephalus TaxID=3402493 RepID=A0A9P0CX24_9CUCU|nr:unnamed protein product [Psylliodes chrysocephala]
MLPQESNRVVAKVTEWERRKQNPVKEAETRKKDLIGYHTKKKLVRDMTPREHRSAKKKWKKANKKRREQQKAVQRLMAIDTPPASPVGTPRNLSPAMRAHVLGRRKVRRDRSKLFRENQKLLTEFEKIRRQFLMYKKRYQRTKKRQSYDDNNNDKYKVLSSAIKIHYSKIKNYSAKRYI